MLAERSRSRGPAAMLAAAVLCGLLAACSGAFAPEPEVIGGTPPAPMRQGTTYRVAPGDTIYVVARRFNVSVRALIDANQLQPPFQLIPGEVLRLPAEGGYVVQRGDTLTAVSRKTGVEFSTLARINNLSPPYLIRVGQRLQLPSSAVAMVNQNGTTVIESPAASNAGAPPPPAPAATAAVTVQPLTAPGAQPPPPPAPTAAAPPPPPLPQITAPPGGYRTLAERDEAGAPPPPPPAPAENAPAAASQREEAPLPPAPGPPIRPSPWQGGTSQPPAANPAPASRAAEPPPAPPLASSSSASPASAPQPPATRPPLQTAAAAPPPPREVSKLGFIWPVHGPVLMPFGNIAKGQHNDGVNIAVPKGTPVLAAADGEVKYAGNELRGFGNLILIKHAGGWVTAYAHNETLLVKKGDHVRRGQRIALSGDSGGVSQPQLHFELRQDVKPIDPATVLPDDLTPASSQASQQDPG